MLLDGITVKLIGCIYRNRFVLHQCICMMNKKRDLG